MGVDLLALASVAASVARGCGSSQDPVAIVRHLPHAAAITMPRDDLLAVRKSQRSATCSAMAVVATASIAVVAATVFGLTLRIAAIAVSANTYSGFVLAMPLIGLC